METRERNLQLKQSCWTI